MARPLLQPDRLKAVVIYTMAFLVIGRVFAGQFPPPFVLGRLVLIWAHERTSTETASSETGRQPTPDTNACPLV